MTGKKKEIKMVGKRKKRRIRNTKRILVSYIARVSETSKSYGIQNHY